MVQQANNKGSGEGQDQDQNKEQGAPRVDTSGLRVTDENGDPIQTPTEGEGEGQGDQTSGLPDGFESIEQLVDAYNDIKSQNSGDDEGTGDEGDTSGNEDAESDDAQNEDEGNQDDNNNDTGSDYENRIRELELQLHDKEIFDLVGGEEQYKEMQQWAENAMEEGEAETFNKVFDSTDLQAKKVAAKALQAMYREANGFEGERVNGNTPSGLKPIQSDGELMEAMQDPRYRRKDSIGEAYRAEIDKRLAAGQASKKGMNADGWMTFGG